MMNARVRAASDGREGAGERERRVDRAAARAARLRRDLPMRDGSGQSCTDMAAMLFVTRMAI
jgi:hypothetical protein